MISLRYDPHERVVWIDGPFQETFRLRDFFKTVPYYRWEKDRKRWEYPLDEKTIDTLTANLEVNGIRVARDGDLTYALAALAQRHEWLHRARNADGAKPDTSGLVISGAPFRHQPDGTRWLVENERVILGDRMGLGKTKMAIDAVATLRARGAIKGFNVVICPNSILYQWRDEIRKLLPEKDGVILPEGSSQQRAALIEEVLAETTAECRPYTWVLLNYEVLRRFPPLCYRLTRNAVVICDEAQKLKNGSAQQSRIVATWTPARLWLLSGTIIANKLIDAWHPANLCQPGLLGFRLDQFEHEHVMRNKFGGIRAYDNLEEIQRRLASICFGRTLEECVDLPPVVYEKRSIELSSNERIAYNRMLQDMRSWLDEHEGDENAIATAANYASRLVRLRQITDGLISQGQGDKQAWAFQISKINAARDVWEDAGRPPTVVWCQWVPVIHRLWEVFEVKPDKNEPRFQTAAMIHGGVPIDRRHELVGRWQTMERPGVLICQIDTAGLGLNLQHGSLQIFVDAPWTPAQRDQCIGRLHRIGQENTVVVVDLVARNTVDERVLRLLEQKTEWVSEATSGIYVRRDMWRELLQ